MTGCKDSDTALPLSDTDDRFGNLVPEVVSLLQRITSIEPVMTYGAGTDVKFVSELSFPDGIGEGEIVAELFEYRDAVRLDLHIEHNRVFATANDGASERRCYLNDYVASVSLDADVDSLPSDFVRGVVAGVTAARDAVRRHNRGVTLPWHQVRVAVRETELVG